MFQDIGLFIIVIVGMGMATGLIQTVLRQRHRGRVDSDGLAAARQVDLLSSENERLKGQVGRLEERIAVLERIATDPAERTMREIEELR